MPGRRILVVDDEPQITRVLRTTLTTHGYEIRIAKDGEAAALGVVAWPSELIIRDISMPKMSGIELVKRVCPSRELDIASWRVNRTKGTLIPNWH